MLTGTTHRSVLLVTLEMSNKGTLMSTLLYEPVLSNMLSLGCQLVRFANVPHLTKKITTVINSFTAYDQYFI